MPKCPDCNARVVVTSHPHGRLHKCTACDYAFVEYIPPIRVKPGDKLRIKLKPKDLEDVVVSFSAFLVPKQEDQKK